MSFGPGRQIAPHGGRVLTDVLVLLADEKEEFVFNDLAIEIPAKIIEAQSTLCRREKVARIEFVVANEFVGTAVIIISTTTRHHIDGSTSVTTILSREV